MGRPRRKGKQGPTEEDDSSKGPPAKVNNNISAAADAALTNDSNVSSQHGSCGVVTTAAVPSEVVPAVAGNGFVDEADEFEEGVVPLVVPQEDAMDIVKGAEATTENLQARLVAAVQHLPRTPPRTVLLVGNVGGGKTLLLQLLRGLSAVIDQGVTDESIFELRRAASSTCPPSSSFDGLVSIAGSALRILDMPGLCADNEMDAEVPSILGEALAQLQPSDCIVLVHRGSGRPSTNTLKALAASAPGASGKILIVRSHAVLFEDRPLPELELGGIFGKAPPCIQIENPLGRLVLIDEAGLRASLETEDPRDKKDAEQLRRLVREGVITAVSILDTLQEMCVAIESQVPDLQAPDVADCGIDEEEAVPSAEQAVEVHLQPHLEVCGSSHEEGKEREEDADAAVVSEEGLRKESAEAAEEVAEVPLQSTSAPTGFIDEEGQPVQEEKAFEVQVNKVQQDESVVEAEQKGGDETHAEDPVGAEPEITVSSEGVPTEEASQELLIPIVDSKFGILEAAHSSAKVESSIEETDLSEEQSPLVANEVTQPGAVGESTVDSVPLLTPRSLLLSGSSGLSTSRGVSGQRRGSQFAELASPRSESQVCGVESVGIEGGGAAILDEAETSMMFFTAEEADSSMMFFQSNLSDGTVCLASSGGATDTPVPPNSVEKPDETTHLVAPPRIFEFEAPLRSEPPLSMLGFGKAHAAEDASDASDSDAGDGASDGELESRFEHLRMEDFKGESEVRQKRADYDSRVRRTADLREELERSKTIVSQVPDQLASELERRRSFLDERVRSQIILHKTMFDEDRLAHGQRALQAKDQEIRFLERQMHSLQQAHQRVQHAREPVSHHIAHEVEAIKRKKMEELRADVEAQDEKIALLNRDISSVLEFMMCLQVEASGGPSKRLTESDIMPPDVRSLLKFSMHGDQLLGGLAKKCMESMVDVEPQPTSFEAPAMSREPLPVAPASKPAVSQPQLDNTLLAAFKQADQLDPEEAPPPTTVRANAGTAADAEPPPVAPRSSDPGHTLGAALEPALTPTASFEDEAWLLRQRLEAEMRAVAEALGGDEMSAGAGVPGASRRELLRAAAWGDEGAVTDALAAGADGDDCEGGGGDKSPETALLGWTAWHAAAAHGKHRVLEALKDELCDRGAHLVPALARTTTSGFSPLALACLRGHTEAVRSLLLGMAPVGVRDTRGNTPLLWCATAERSGNRRDMAKLLVEARADPSACNDSGQGVDLAVLLASPEGPAVLSAQPTASGSEQVLRGRAPDRHIRALAQPRADSPAAEDFHEPYHCIQSIGATPGEPTGIIASVLGLAWAPIRDACGMEKSTRAQELARMSPEELEIGVWSEWVTNYTHAGLRKTLGLDDASESFGATAAPTLRERNRQALVLTCDRLLFFNAAKWTLAQEVRIMDISEVVLSSNSDTVLLLRMHRVADVILDLQERGRFLDELRIATSQISKRWGGADFGEHGVPVVVNPEMVSGLLDDKGRRAGTIAYVEPGVFLLLPYAPDSLLLAGTETFHFGFLDVQRTTKPPGAGQRWRWQLHFFVLKTGTGADRRLIWCSHPNDAEGVGCIWLDNISQVSQLENPYGDLCLIIDHCPRKLAGENREQPKPELLTLRARSAKSREDWAMAIRALQSVRVGSA